MTSNGEAQTGVPAGWKELHPEDPFNRCNGPYYVAQDCPLDVGEPSRLGFLVSEDNCNYVGICHGGQIGAALDIALGSAVQAATGASHTPTITLTVDFMRPALKGEWIESRVRLLRTTRSVAFIDGILIGPGGTVARASGVFKLPSPKAT